jgi:hypothetical protein
MRLLQIPDVLLVCIFKFLGGGWQRPNRWYHDLACVCLANANKMRQLQSNMNFFLRHMTTICTSSAQLNPKSLKASPMHNRFQMEKSLSCCLQVLKQMTNLRHLTLIAHDSPDTTQFTQLTSLKLWVIHLNKTMVFANQLQELELGLDFTSISNITILCPPNLKKFKYNTLCAGHVSCVHLPATIEEVWVPLAMLSKINVCEDVKLRVLTLEFYMYSRTENGGVFQLRQTENLTLLGSRGAFEAFRALIERDAMDLGHVRSLQVNELCDITPPWLAFSNLEHLRVEVGSKICFSQIFDAYPSLQLITSPDSSTTRTSFLAKARTLEKAMPSDVQYKMPGKANNDTSTIIRPTLKMSTDQKLDPS